MELTVTETDRKSWNVPSPRRRRCSFKLNCPIRFKSKTFHLTPPPSPIVIVLRKCSTGEGRGAIVIDRISLHKNQWSFINVKIVNSHGFLSHTMILTVINHCGICFVHHEEVVPMGLPLFVVYFGRNSISIASMHVYCNYI